MAGIRYGTRRYGTAYYGGEAVGEFTTPTFDAHLNGYGRILLTWGRPGGAWDRLRLVHSLAGPPVDEDDGAVVLDVPRTALLLQQQEEGREPGRRHYYAIFVRELAVDRWRRAGVLEVLATRDFGYADRLYGRVPEVFKAPSYATLMTEREDDRDSLLYRFLSLFGLQFDHLRTELESMRGVYDARTVSSRMLPALAHLVAVDYEPELGDRSVRRMAANAMRVHGMRGTLAGARELATAFTGWDCAVRLGVNLALDRLMSGPDGGRGQWTTTSTSNEVVYRSFTASDAAPVPVQGYVVVRRSSGSATTMQVQFRPRILPSDHYRQYDIPILPGLVYTASWYVRTPSPGVTATPEVRTSAPAESGPGRTNVTHASTTVFALTSTWQRVSVTFTASPGARYAEARLPLAMSPAFTPEAGEVHVCGFQLEEGATATAWRPAREVNVFLRADVTNYVGNTSGYELLATGWRGATAVRAPDGTSMLSYTSNLADWDPTLELVDALPVEMAGDGYQRTVSYFDVQQATVTDTYAGRLAKFPTYASATNMAHPELTAGGLHAVYIDGLVEVGDRDWWSVLVDVSGVYGEREREVQVGFALYDGPLFVRYQWCDVVMVSKQWRTVGYEYQVPDSADFDRIAFAIRASDAVVGWRNAALEPVRLVMARQFDGQKASFADEYLWEGERYRSPSHFYAHRTGRAARLRELLEDYLPHPAQFRLRFATPVEDGPRSSAGSDINPADDQTVTVGRRMRFRWSSATLAGTSRQLAWRVESRVVHDDLNLRWSQQQLNKELRVSWNVIAPVGRSIEIVYDQAQVGRDASLVWRVAEQLVLTDGYAVD